MEVTEVEVTETVVALVITAMTSVLEAMVVVAVVSAEDSAEALAEDPWAAAVACVAAWAMEAAAVLEVVKVGPLRT